MNIIKILVRSLAALGIACGCWLLLPRARAADAPVLPPIIEDEFTLWTKGGAIDGVLSVWQKGGLMEGDSKISSQANYLPRINQFAGNYRSYEVLQTKQSGRSSQVIYLAIRCDRAAVYARFLLYRTEKEWVVQNVDFNTRPEALMPWLAFEGDRSAEH